jgi:hypothetical protein
MSLHGSAALLSGEVYVQVRVPAVAFSDRGGQLQPQPPPPTPRPPEAASRVK